MGELAQRRGHYPLYFLAEYRLRFIMREMKIPIWRTAELCNKNINVVIGAQPSFFDKKKFWKEEPS
jgi:hypothetical protein